MANESGEEKERVEKGGERVKDIDISVFVRHLEFKSRDTDVPVSTESGDTSTIQVTINLKDQRESLSHILE